MKIIHLFILTLLCLACNSYSNNMKQNPLANKFYTGAYNAPPKNQLTQKNINDIAEAGIDVIVAGGDSECPESIHTLMNFAEKAGIKVIPIDYRWIKTIEKPTAKTLAATIKKIVRDYSNNPTLLAYGIYDEPDAGLFPTLSAYAKEFEKNDSAHPPLINLLPSYGSPIQLGASNFREYIREYIKIVNPLVLSYDYYPFRDGVTLFDGWHNDLKIVREESRNSNIPFWIFVQSEGITGGLKVPTREEIFWQANTALAYGARGILWFCYWTPPYHPDSKLPEKHFSAMIDINGKKTPVYDYVKEVNHFLQKAGKQLADWDNKYIARYKSGKLISKKIFPVGNVKDGNSDLIVGAFTKNKNVRVVFSNDSCSKNAAFTFIPGKIFKFVKIIDTFHAKIIQKNNALKFEIKPGGCSVIEFSTHSADTSSVFE